MSTAWKKVRYPLEWLEFGLDSEWRYPRLEGKCFFSFKLGNPTQQTRRFIELSAMNILLLLVIGLLVLSGPYVNAGPVGNFFKKVGQSISKPLQRDTKPQPQPQPQPESARPQPAQTSHATRRPSSRAAPAAAATPPAVAQPARPSKEEQFTGTVRGISAANM